MSIPRSKNGQSAEVPAEPGGRADTPVDVGSPGARPRDRGAHGLTIRTERLPGRVAVIRVIGEIDMATVPRFSEVLHERLRGTLCGVVLDLSGVTFLSCSGGSVIAQARQKARARKIGLTLISGGSVAVHAALSACGLTDALTQAAIPEGGSPPVTRGHWSEQRSPQVPAQPSSREGSREEPISDQPLWGLQPHSSSDPPTKPDIDKSELAEVPGHREPSTSIPVVRGEHAQLVPRRGPGSVESFTITASRTTLGRHRDNDIVLDDPSVSAHHVELHMNGGKYTVTDLGSLNGTYVNRRSVARAELNDGDEIGVGKTRFVFIMPAS